MHDSNMTDVVWVYWSMSEESSRINLSKKDCKYWSI